MPEGRWPNDGKKPRRVDPSIGLRIKQLRKARKLTQHQLANASGLAYKTITNYEQGLSLPGLISAVKLASALSVELSDLCFIPFSLRAEDLPTLPIGSARGRKRS